MRKKHSVSVCVTERESECVCTCVKLHASLFDLGFDIMLGTRPAKCPISDLNSLKHGQWFNQDQAVA